MSKHLKVRATLSRDMKTVRLQILEQSHRAHEFGPNKSFDSSNFSLNWFQLVSCMCPVYLNEGTLYVRGSVKSYDDTISEIPIKDWPRVKEAIIAYNEWGRNQE